jgi:ferredoxin-NADP reductase
VLVHRYADQPLFAGELAVLARERGLRVLAARPPAGPGLLARRRAGPGDLDALRGWVPDIAERDVYVCGPEAWADDVRRDLLAAGLPPTTSISRASGGDP